MEKMKINNNSDNLAGNEPTNYTLVSTDTLRNVFPGSPGTATTVLEPGLTREGFFLTLGKASRKFSEPAAKKTQTSE